MADKEDKSKDKKDDSEDKKGKYKAQEFIDVDKDGDPDAAIVEKSSAKGGFIPETPEEAEMLSVAGGGNGEFTPETPEEAKMLSSASGGTGEFNADSPEEQAMLDTVSAPASSWRDVTDADIEDLIAHTQPFDGDDENAEVDYAIDKYTLPFPNDDAPYDEWDEFYGDAGPFGRFAAGLKAKKAGTEKNEGEAQELDSTGTISESDADDPSYTLSDESMKNIISALSDCRF